MTRLLIGFICALFLSSPASVWAGAEEDALKALDDANARVLGLSAIKSPSIQNFQSAQGELSTLGPFFQRVGDALSKVNIGPGAQLVEVGASVQAKVVDAGKVSTVNIAVFIDACRGLSADLSRWQSLLPEVRRALQQRVDANTQNLIREQVMQTFPTPIPGVAGGSGVGLPTPVPGVSTYVPTPIPTLPPLVPPAATPTPIPPADGGVIPGGWTPAAPTPTPVLGVPTSVPTPQGQLKAPVPIAVGRNGQRVWVANVRSNSVSVMETGSQRFVTEIPVGAQPQALALDDGDNNLVVANFGSNNVSIIDGRSDQVLKTISVPTGPMQALVTHGGKAYVLCQDGKSIAVIDLKLKLLLKSIALSSRPGRMDLPNSHQKIYVTLPDEDAVAVIDTGFDSVVATIKE